MSIKSTWNESTGTKSKPSMLRKILILVISFVAIAGRPVLQNTDSTRAETLWDHSSQKANQAIDKTDLIKEEDKMWKNSLENSDLYGVLSTRNGPQSPDTVAGDLNRKLSLESQRLQARLAQELRELRERLATAFSAHPSPSPRKQCAPATSCGRLAALAQRLRDALEGDTRKLCSSLNRCSRGSETSDGSVPEEYKGYQEVVQSMGQLLDNSEREVTTHLAEFQTEVSKMMGGQGDATTALRAEVERYAAGVQSRVRSLKAVLAETQSLGDGLSKHVDQFCHSSEEENRLFAGRIERQLETSGRGQGEGLEEVPSLSPSSTGSLGEDFSPKLSALLHDILQTLN
ncbi:hypothetical protein GJAV_G00057010 [Gymnothorax javanicus]|nr:hypothetical protein GJAV_G00057010 [Gymnothorax javanicus]